VLFGPHDLFVEARGYYWQEQRLVNTIIKAQARKYHNRNTTNPKENKKTTNGSEHINAGSAKWTKLPQPMAMDQDSMPKDRMVSCPLSTEVCSRFRFRFCDFIHIRVVRSLVRLDPFSPEVRSRETASEILQALLGDPDLPHMFYVAGNAGTRCATFLANFGHT
jgi:hypothetical protein